MELVPCNKCDVMTPVSEFPAGRRRCRPCLNAASRERGAAWRAKNPERDSERHRRHYRENRAAILAKQIEYNAKNPAALARASRRHYEANRDRLLADAKVRRMTEPEVFSARNRSYRESHPEVVAEASRRYHARRRGAEVVEAGVTWRSVSERDGMDCHYCEVRCDPKDGHRILARDGARRWVCGPTYPTVDHVVPVSTGGHHAMANAVLSCLRCNQRKGGRRVD